MNNGVMNYYTTNYQQEFNKFRAQESTYVNYCLNMIIYIINTIGPREPGSHSERAAQEIMINDLKSYADTVDSEFFEVHPYALMGWVVLDGFLLLFSVFFYNFQHRFISFILTLLAMIFLVVQFLMYREFLDPIFPRSYSSNVVAVLKPVGEIKRRIIFNGHTDSQYEWWYNYLGGGHLITGVIATAIICAIASFVLQIIFFRSYHDWLATAMIIVSPFFLAILFFTNWNTVVPGANDNLTGCVCAMSVLKYMKDNNIRFENTEVRVVLTGCEECGLRGAKAYARAHPPDGIETGFFAFDTLRDLDDMAIYYRDLSGTVRNDQRVCNIMKKAGDLAGLDLPFKILFFGASDAGAISQGGIPAATFAAMDPAPASYYHTRRDNIDNMEPKAIGFGLDIAIGSLFIFDQEGLVGNT